MGAVPIHSNGMCHRLSIIVCTLITLHQLNNVYLWISCMHEIDGIFRSCCHEHQ